MENESKEWGSAKTFDGDGSETGSVTKKKGNNNRRPVSGSASPRSSGMKRRAIKIYIYSSLPTLAAMITAIL